MTKARTYPETDAPERDAVLAFEVSVDTRYVKTDIKTSDKIPNTDGWVELVDENRRSLGSFQVQVRKIPRGATKYSCPTSLVDYSKRSSTPLVLVCSDPDLPRVFWRHICPTMPEYKPNQDSFTIHFSAKADLVDRGGICLQRWSEILSDYQERIEQYPQLASELAQKLRLDTLDSQTKYQLQKFIDAVNRLLDNDFTSAKAILYPGVWKLGVGVLGQSKRTIWYQLYTVPYGAPSPLVTELEGCSLLSDNPNPNAILECELDRDRLSDPKQLGTGFVLERVQKLVEHQGLSVHGEMLAADILVDFIDRYHVLLGVPPDHDQYSVTELDYALSAQLLGLAAAVALERTRLQKPALHVDLDWLLREVISSDQIEPISLDKVPLRLSIGSKRISLRSVSESLRYLVANQVNAIERPFAQRQELPPGGHWIWDGYLPQDETIKVTRILEASLTEYSKFVQGNHLKFPNSPYLDQNTSIVYVFEIVDEGSTHSTIAEHHLLDSSMRLPKLSVFVGSEASRFRAGEDWPVVYIDNIEYRAISSDHYATDFLYDPTPVRSLVYRMLVEDLSRHYGVSCVNVV